MPKAGSDEISRSPRKRSRGRGSRATDVRTVDAIIRAMYDVICGPAGQKRDWDRFRSLYLPEARFILAVTRKGARPEIRILDVKRHIARAKPIFTEEDFWEVETSRKLQTFGNIAHVISTYELRRQENGKAFHRGVNSIQLVNDGTRWWIASVMWNTERG